MVQATYLNSGANPQGAGSSTPATQSGINLPWDANLPFPDLSSFTINWNSGATGLALVKQVEQQYEAMVNWLQNNPGSYNGQLALMDMTLDIGQNMSAFGSAASQMQSFMNNELSSQVGNTSFLGYIVQTAIEATAMQSGQAAADTFANQLTSLLSGMTGYGATFNSMYGAAYSESLNSDQGINYWFSQHYVTLTDPVSGQQETVWVDDNGNQMTFDQFAGESAFNNGTYLLQSSNPSQYVDSLYESQIQQICDTCQNPWERMMLLLALVNNRINDMGQDMNGFTGNVNALSTANGDITDMENLMKNPTAANMKQFYQDFSNLQQLIGDNPNLSSLTSDLNSVEGIFNGNTAAFPTTAETVKTSTAPASTLQMTANQWYEFTPSGTTTPVYMIWDGNAKDSPQTYTGPSTSDATASNPFSTDSSNPGQVTFTTAGNLTTAFTPWNVAAGQYTLPEGVYVEYTPTNGSTEYLEWDGQNINVYTTLPPSPTNTGTQIPSLDGTTYLSGGTLCISPMDNIGMTTSLTYGDLQGLGDYNDISTSMTAAQQDYSSTVSSNNANTITSLQTYTNSVASANQQEYQTYSSMYQSMLSSFGQFLQSWGTVEGTMTTNMQSANS